MQLLWFVFFLALSPCSWAFFAEAPVGKCKNPMPTVTGFRYDHHITGDEQDFFFTPNAEVYQSFDNIKMLLKKTEKPKFYTVTISGTPLQGSVRNIEFNAQDIGNGVLKMTLNGAVHQASVVTMTGATILFYLCSDVAGKADAFDSLYVMGPTWMRKLQDPLVLFQALFRKYTFNKQFYKLPRNN